MICNKNFKNSATQKRNRKSEDPIRFALETQQPSDHQSTSTWICKNSRCKAVSSIKDAFCRRCSCSICHRFDLDKDPSLWLVCESETAPEDFCGSSCHIECALKHEKAGVVKLGQYMQLDGCYLCASCGKVSELLECLKKQLAVAKDTPRVTELCYRLLLSDRLLNGTSMYEKIHDIITEAKTLIEAEVGPLNGDSVNMSNNAIITDQLAVATNVRKLCSYAINKADKFLHITPNCTVDSLPAACRFQFEEVTPSSLIIVLVDIPTPFTDLVKGYKLWCCKSTDKSFSSPLYLIPRDKRRVCIKSLQPCTEYTFRIVSYTEATDLGHSEAKCFTKSASAGCKTENNVGNLGNILNGFCSAGVEPRRGESQKNKNLPCVIRELDLNVVSMPDLNEDLTPPFESSRDDNGYPLERGTRTDDDAASHGIEKNGPSIESRHCAPTRRRATSDNSLINGSPICFSNRPGSLDENYEDCVKVIRWLECEGYIKPEFRLKLLTWFSLGSTEHERRVVNTFIRTLVDDPRSLAGQLVDSFADIIASKRPRTNLTSKFPTIN